MKRNNKKGFTIVELVIVIAVIAILAGVLIPTFAGAIGKAQESADDQFAKNAHTTLSIYNENGEWDKEYLIVGKYYTYTIAEGTGVLSDGAKKGDDYKVENVKDTVAAANDAGNGTYYIPCSTLVDSADEASVKGVYYKYVVE